MMPINEIEIEKIFIDKNNYKILIQAGKNGWSVLWGDYSSFHYDEVNTAESNYLKAYNIAKDEIGELFELV